MIAFPLGQFPEHLSIEIISQLDRRTHLIFPPLARPPRSESDFREFGNPLMSQSDNLSVSHLFLQPAELPTIRSSGRHNFPTHRAPSATQEIWHLAMMLGNHRHDHSRRDVPFRRGPNYPPVKMGSSTTSLSGSIGARHGPRYTLLFTDTDTPRSSCGRSSG